MWFPNLEKWDEAYKTKSEIKGVLNDSSFSIFDLNVGDVYGPYVEEGEYRLAKVLGKKVIPRFSKIKTHPSSS